MCHVGEISKMAEDNPTMGGKAEHGKPGTHVSEHLSNERTYLSYLRTSVSLMSFGIAINRFSLFLVQSNSGPSNLPLGSRLVSSERLGVGMVALAWHCWLGPRFTTGSCWVKSNAEIS